MDDRLRYTAEIGTFYVLEDGTVYVFDGIGWKETNEKKIFGTYRNVPDPDWSKFPLSPEKGTCWQGSNGYLYVFIGVWRLVGSD